ncbi:unnamed protein product [Prunus armeniaca]
MGEGGERRRGRGGDGWRGGGAVATSPQLPCGWLSARRKGRLDAARGGHSLVNHVKMQDSLLCSPLLPKSLGDVPSLSMSDKGV